MGKLMYSPADGDHPVTVAFGLSFNAGKAVEVDEAVFAKLKTNPQFKVTTAKAADNAPEIEPEIRPEIKPEIKKVDGRSKEAKAARAAAAEEEAKARADEHKADLEEALAEHRQEMN